MVLLAPAPIDDVIVVMQDGPTRGAASFTTNTPPGTWDAAKLPVTFVLGGPKSRDVGDAAGSEIAVALRTWTSVRCTGFRATYGGEEPSRAAADDGVNAIVFHDDAWPAELVKGALAQTVVTVDGSGKIRDADIHINGADYRFSLDGAAGTQDLRSVLVHEIGHALGLGHSNDARATMNVSGSGLRWRSLEKDDIDGVCTLYPGAGAPACPVDPCPAGLVCVGGACQRAKERGDLCSPCAASSECEAAGDDARCIEIDGGRVCGRGCATDADCGQGFACKPTTEAGDLQCVTLDGCRSAANPCTTDAECTGSLCRNGACVGPSAVGPSDAGTSDAASDAGAPTETPNSGGCDCTTAPSRNEGGIALALAALVSARALQSRRERARRSKT